MTSRSSLATFHLLKVDMVGTGATETGATAKGAMEAMTEALVAAAATGVEDTHPAVAVVATETTGENFN